MTERPVLLHQCIQFCFVESVRLIAGTWISELAGQKSEQKNSAIRDVPNWLGNQYLSLCSSDHPVDYARGFRQEVISAGLHNHVLGPRQRSGLVEIPDNADAPLSRKPIYETPIYIDLISINPNPHGRIIYGRCFPRVAGFCSLSIKQVRIIEDVSGQGISRTYCVCGK